MGMGARTRRTRRIAAAMPIFGQLIGHTGELDAVWWARRSGSDNGLWLSIPISRNARGDEPLAESNYRVIQADLERVSAFGTDYRIDLWPGGQIHTLQVRADDALALRAVDGWIDALQDYPVACDSDLSDEEWKQNHPTNFITGEITECYADRDADDPCPCGVTEDEDEEDAA